MKSGYVVSRPYSPDLHLPDTPGEIHVRDGALFFYDVNGDIDNIFAAGQWESIEYVVGED